MRLLLLGINNKFTAVLNRIRILTEEKRKIIFNAAERDFHPAETHRIESITRQVVGLLDRAQSHPEFSILLPRSSGLVRCHIVIDWR